MAIKSQRPLAPGLLSKAFQLVLSPVLEQEDVCITVDLAASGEFNEILRTAFSKLSVKIVERSVQDITFCQLTELKEMGTGDSLLRNVDLVFNAPLYKLWNKARSRLF